jgi:DNA-binding CsgD family transcriptional regulator
VINSINKGLKTREIADKLNISSHTVATHRKNIMRKANCSNVKQLLVFCSRNGILKSVV